MVRHVIRAAESLVAIGDIVIATSTASSDDPVVSYCTSLGATVIRGPLDDVIERFRLCARQRPTDWLLRLNADSPLIPPHILARIVDARNRGTFDLITTIFPRTFARGHNAELIRRSALLAIGDEELTAEDREHVTAFFYKHSARFAICNIESETRVVADASFAVDTLDDLRRLEQLDPAQVI